MADLVEQALIDRTSRNLLTNRPEQAATHAPYDSLMGTSSSNNLEAEKEYPSTRSLLNKDSNQADRTFVPVEEDELTPRRLG